MRRFWIPVLLLVATATALLFLQRATIDSSAREVAVAPPNPATAPPPSAALVPPTRDASDTTAVEPRGTGSERDPYRLNWPILMAAERSVGADGDITVPSNIARYDGTHVEISGYLAPPVAVDQTSELLVMRNRWDGCCIGTPPTAFDCIEVALSQSVSVRGRHLISYGTIRGRMRIEPFRVGRFLLALYRIEEGTVDGFGR